MRLSTFAVILTSILIFISFSAISAPIPSVLNQSPNKEFIGENFCFNASFSNTGSDIGYGPYYLLRLAPDLAFQSASFNGLPLGVVSNQTFTDTGILNDPISGLPINGIENGRLVALTIPVGSFSNSQPALMTQICLAVDANAIPDIRQSDAIAMAAGFRFGDSATGNVGDDTILGSENSNDFTPAIIKYSISDTQVERELPPGPAWTYPIVAKADIAGTSMVAPIEFPTITLPGNVKFTGAPTINGGVNCSLMPDAASLEAMTGLGTPVDINIACDAGMGSSGNNQDIRIDFDVYIVDTLNNMTCDTTGAINTAKHLTLVKNASGSGRPGSVVTYTYNYRTSEFIPGISSFTVTDVLQDGLSFSDIGGNQVQLSISHGAVNTTLNVPFTDMGSTASFTNADILNAIVMAGGSIDAAQSGTISYTAVIDQNYNDNSPVLTRDIINNNVTATYSIAGADNAQNCSETSAASITIDDVSVSKSTIGSSTVKPGDVVQFQLRMSVPSGDADSVVLTDVLPLPVFKASDFPTFNGDLNAYPGSSSAGSFIEYASGSSQPGNVSITTSDASNSVIIDFGDISSNVSQTIILNLFAKASAEPYVDGLSLANLLNTTTNNSATDSATDNSVTEILVRAPDVSIIKEITSDTSDLDAGDQIDYKITLQNQGGAGAFDVIVTDILGDALEQSSCSVPNLTGGSGSYTGTLATGLKLDNTLGSAGSGLGEAGSGFDIATLTYSCNIKSDISVNTLVANKGELRFSAGIGQNSFPMRESTVDVRTKKPSIVKTLVASSEPYTNGTDLAIGEVARFRIVTTLPEGTHRSVTVRDLLSNRMVYANDGSAKIAFVGSAITSTGFADPGSCSYLTLDPNITPDCSISTSNNSFNPGQDPTFNLGIVTNSDSDIDEEFIVLELNVIKVDTGNNGVNFNNRARYRDSNSGNINSPRANLRRVDPALTLNKQVDNTGGDAQDAIVYTLTIAAPANSPSPAFDISLSDVLPPELNYVNGSAAFDSCAAVTASFDDSDPNGVGISLSIDTLAAGESCIFTYHANVSQAAIPGQAITNTATLNWTSLDGAGLALMGTVPGVEKSYQTSDSEIVTVNITSSEKSIVATSFNHTSEAGRGTNRSPKLLSIGEQITYRLVVTVPEGTASNFVIRDNLPTGLEFIPASAAIALVNDGSLTSSLGSALCSGGSVNQAGPISSVTPNCSITPTLGAALGAADNSVDFNIGNVTNIDNDSDDEYIVIEFSALVNDQLSNQQNTNLSNQFEVLLSGLQNSVSNNVVAKIVEPQLTLTSSTSPISVDNRVDETPSFAWTLTLTNTGQAKAFQIQDGDTGNWQIQLPSGVENITGLSVSSSGQVIDNSDLVSPITAANFSVSGTDNNLLSIDRIFAMEPAAQLIITFDSTLKSSVTPGSTLSVKTALGYAGQQAGGPTQDVRNFADISSGSGNNPITATSAPLNNYRTETAISVVTTTSTPVIGLAKELRSKVFDATSGTFNVVYRLYVENSGDVALTNIQLIDDLAAAFNPIDASDIDVTSVSSTDFTINDSFNGTSNKQLIDNTSPSTLAIGETKTLDIALTISPKTNLGIYNNSATATAQSARDAGNNTSDISVNGTDPDPANDGPDNDSSTTPVVFTVDPEIALAKAQTGAMTNNGDGSYTFSYRFNIKNIGDVDLTDVQIIDDLDSVFIDADSFAVDQLTSSDLTVNSDYDGEIDTNILAPNQTLAVGNTASLDMTVTVIPANNLGPYNNTARATATSPNGNATDISDNGTNPETNNGDGGLADPTPVTFAEAPAIGLAKTSTNPINNGDGTHTVTYSMVVKNTGDIRLTDVQVSDDLTTAFSGATFTVDSTTATSGLSINRDFNGVDDTDLLAANQTLAVGDEGTLTLTVIVTPGTNLGAYNNSATASANSPSDANVSDISDNGTNPETNNGNGGLADPTPVTFAEAPAIGVSKAISNGPINNGDGTHTVTYSMVVKNTGDIRLTDVQVSDDLTTAFSGATFTVDSTTATSGLSINRDFNGVDDTDLLAANQTLAVGDEGTLTLTVIVTPGTNLGAYNNSATASANSPSGANVSDISDNGTNPETNNGNGGLADPTPVTFAEAPAIGMAKAISNGPINNGDGTHTLTYSMVVKNTGDIRLTDVQVSDDLTTAFSGATFTVDSTTATSGLSINRDFNGVDDTDLLAANQTLAVGDEGTLTLTVTVTPGTNLGAYNNSATASANSPSGANVSDISDNGTNPETNNGNGGLADPTPVTFAEAPAIGVAKAISNGPINNGDGTHTLTYSMVVKNTGDIRLTDVQVSDDLTTAFSGATFTVDSTTATSGLSINRDFNGVEDTDLLAANQTLAVGDEATLTLTVTVTPGTNLGAYSNSATASANSPSDANVSDISDNGTNPETNNGNGGLADPTPVTFAEAPAIGVAKVISNGPVNNSDGSYNISYDIVVKNTGDIKLTNIQLEDDLSSAFSGASYSITAISSPFITVNNSFNGDSNKQLIAANQSLNSGARATIKVALTVTPGANLGPYYNSAIGSGISPGGTTVSDISDAGSNPESDNGSGGLDDPTPVSFDEAPAIGIAKRVSVQPENNNDGSYTLSYAMVVRNNGDVDLSNLQVIEDFAATYPLPATVTVNSLTSSSISANSNFNGYSDQNLLDDNQSLAVGASAAIELKLTVLPTTFLGPYNNTAKASAISPSGAAVGDDSDDGSDPNGDNNSGGFNDPTPITFTEAPSIAMAKAIQGSITNNQDGSYSFVYSLVLQNNGDVPANNVQVVDDLASVFAGASVTSGTINSNELSLNSNFNGSSDTYLLADNQSLAVGQTATITLPVTVTPGANLGPYNNTAMVSAVSPSGTEFSDSSDNGTDPLTDNGSGGFADPTPVLFSEAPAVGIAKALLNASSLADGRYQLEYQLNAKNTGDIVLNNLQISEHLAVVFSAAKNFEVTSLSSDTLTVNSGFNGETDLNLLAANQFLQAGENAALNLTIIVTPGAELGPYNNSVTITATSPSGNEIIDLSDNGLDPETNNNSGGQDDPTPVVFTEAPQIGLAKSLLAEPNNNRDGSYNVSYQLVVKNHGDIALSQVQINDQLANTFPAPASFVVNSVSANNLAVNSSFDGVNNSQLLADNQTLAVGESDILTLALTVTPGTNLGPYNNTAKASAISPSGASVDDISDNGTNSSGDNGQGSEDDPTPLLFSEAPAIAVTKALINLSNLADGRYQLEYQFNAKNTGDIVLKNTQIREDLATVFSDVNSFEIIALSSNDLTVNSGFNGETDLSLLAGNQTLEADESATLNLTIIVTPGSKLGPYNNSVTITAISPSGNEIRDISDNGLNPETNNSSGGQDDPTPVTFTETPQIGLAKSLLAEPINNRDGSYNLRYQLVVKNLGDIALSDVQIVDQLADTFPNPASFVVTELSANNFTINSDFDGINNAQLLANNQILSVGDSDILTLALTVTPGSNLGPYNNSASASATSPSGAAVEDISDNGTNPSGYNGEGSEADPTPVTFIENPAIGVAKALINVSNLADGRYQLEYQFNAKNTGDIVLNNLQIIEDLASVFSNANSFEVIALSSADLIVNSGFNGRSETHLLAANQTLEVGENAALSLTIIVTPGANLGPYNNTVTALGTSPSGAQVTDLSDNGLDSESNNGSGGQDDVTPVTFTEAPQIGLAKSLVSEPINNRDGTYSLSYQLVVENLGDIALSDVQIIDQLANTFPAPARFVVTSFSGNNLTVNSDFNGVNNAQLLADNQTLAVGERDTLTLAITVTPGANLGPYNNSAEASAISPSSAQVTDLSDNGLSPSGNNGEGNEDDPTPVLFTEAPAIGIAKTISGDIQPTVNGTAGNFDVPFEFTIENIGDVPLTDIQLVDDLPAQFGDAYVSIISSPEIVNSTAQELPLFIDSTSESLLFDGQSGRLMPGERLTLRFTLELDPSSDDAKGVLTNQARAVGLSSGGQSVDDLSDSGTNATDNPNTGGNNTDAPGDTGGTDDPTPFELPSGSLQGIVWLDGDRNDELSSGETLLVGWNIIVRDTNGTLLASRNTDENGFFLVDNLPQDDYTLEFITPSGTTFVRKTVSVPANESVNVPVPVDPSGVVYNSITRLPVANALVSMVDANGIPLPDACLLPNQQNQITGDDGFYFFLLLLDSSPACSSGDRFALEVTAPEEQYLPGHSQLILPQDGSFDPTGLPSPYGLSNSEKAPQIGDATRYYMAFDIANGDPDVINNHIPVDEIGVNPSMIRLTKRADSRDTLVGGLVRYTVQVENISDVDVSNLTLVDTLPAGFTYVQNSIFTNDVDGALQLESINPLTVSGIDVPAQETVDIVYILRVGAGVARGTHTNRVSPYLGDALIGNEATAEVIVGADPDFEEVTILGKVFDDRDGDNWQDSANASDLFIQGGINAEHYIASSTTVFNVNGERLVVNDSNNGSPLITGIELGDLTGRSSEADTPRNHQVIIRQKLSKLEFNDELVLTTAEGSAVLMNRDGDTFNNHIGEVKQGLNAQNLTLQRAVTLLANGHYQVDLIIQNTGIQEMGIPGVRVATVEGLYVETDAYGRFHLAAVDVANLARGRNFYMKVDTATLPPNSEFISENPRVKRITQGLPTRFDFAVKLASQPLGGEQKHALIKVGELLFNDNSAEVTVEQQAWIPQMADTINQYQGGQIQIIGQADQQALAYQRASNTYQALLPLIREDLRENVSVELVEQVDEKFAPVVNISHITELGKVLFDTDKSTVKTQYAALLDGIATQLISAQSGHLAITGFADSRASEDYNLALGLRRAKAVFSELKTRMPRDVWENLTIKIRDVESDTNLTITGKNDINTEGE